MMAKKCVALLMLIGIAGSGQTAERIHFLTPGGADGGWDTTARGVGEALARSGIVGVASYENLSGGGGSRAMTYLIGRVRYFVCEPV